MNSERDQVEDDDHDFDCSEAGPISWRSQFSQQKSGKPDDEDPLVPKRKERSSSVDRIDRHAAGQDVERHEEDVGGQVAAELDDRGFVVLVVQGQRKDDPERRTN